MKDFVVVLQGLPIPVKLAVALTVCVAAGIFLFIVFQSPIANPQASAGEPPFAGRPDPIDSKSQNKPSAAAAVALLPKIPRSKKRTRSASPSVVQPAKSPSADEPTISVGNVTSNQQSGGITAGYVGKVEGD